MLANKKKCRICKGDFIKKNFLEYKSMPSSAQNFPKLKNLKNEKGINLLVCQCSKCGIVQVVNKPVGYYKEVIRSSAFSKEMKDYRKNQFKKFINKYKLKKKKIIEIGSGYGEYLSLLDKENLKSFGIEFSNSAIKASRKKKLNVMKGYINKVNYKLNHSPFDAFFIFSFLEHMPNINVVLRAIHKNLNQNSIGLIEVPNFNLILKKKLFSEFIRDHLFYFTKESLEIICKKNGFELIDISYVWHDYIISAVVKKSTNTKHMNYKKITPLNLKSLIKKKESIKNKINMYVDKHKKGKVVVWGAGHQALTLISLTNLSKKIDFVVDSAPFKQGKYTPSSHIPIISPEKLMKINFEAVIVMAASYTDEVVKILLKKYKKNFSISMFKENKFIIIR